MPEIDMNDKHYLNMLENNEDNLEKTKIEPANAKDNTSEAVESIEKTVAENSETKVDSEEIAMENYDSMEIAELNIALENLLKNHTIQKIKPNIEAIKAGFNSRFSILLAEKKEIFLAEGGNIIDFQFNFPEKTEFNSLLGQYKKKREAHYKAIEKDFKDNLQKRNTIIEDLKLIIEKADPKTMYNEYKALNDQWKTIGAVHRDHYNDVWKIYHHHVERFYDLLHLNKNFRELDFKHNLEEKLKIITRAEKLAEATDVNLAFQELQNLHLIWKEEVGPVSREHREDIWDKFSQATKKLHDRRHEYFKETREKVNELISAKLKVIQEIEAYSTETFKTHKDWQKGIKEIEVLRTKFFDLGKLPYNKSEPVWQKFKIATKKFNNAKNIFYKDEKRVQSDNLRKKQELIEIAEKLKDSEDWENTITKLKKIQSEWKSIGHVPRKFSDDVWKKFKDACNHFFNRLNDKNNKSTNEQNEIVTNKKAYLDVFKTKENLNMEEIQNSIIEWRNLGNLPKNVRFLDGKFNKLVDKILEKQDMSRSDIEMLKFKNVIDNYLVQEDFNRIDNEQLFLRRKIDEIVRDMQQLENNLSFISNPTEDNPFVKNVRKGIDEHKNNLDLWQNKLNYLKSLKY